MPPKPTAAKHKEFAPKPTRRRSSGRADGNDISGGSSASLKAFSLIVKEKVKALKETTYKDVADALVEDMKKTSPVVNDQNIRRRVYDILNVLAAIGMIVKQKKIIVWRGRLGDEPQSEVATLEQQKRRLQQVVAKKRAYVEEMKQKWMLYQATIDYNRMMLQQNRASDAAAVSTMGVRYPQPTEDPYDANEVVPFPFILVYSKGGFTEQADIYRRHVKLVFKESFQLLEDADVIKKLGFAQPPQPPSFYVVDPQQAAAAPAEAAAAAVAVGCDDSLEGVAVTKQEQSP